MTHHLQPPTLEWRDGAPFDPAYGDIYFNPDDGLAETQHVFLQGNDLPKAWQSRQKFVVGELGFGTGLNFFATWDLWRRTGPVHGHLFYISVEGAPMRPAQLAQCHAPFPAFAEMSDILRRKWPGPVRGLHRLEMAPDITLLLLFGLAEEMLPRLEATVDAWFLDGFAPAHNEAMWSDPVFREIARCSRTGTTLATFTAAGAVRAAIAAAGFDVARVPGYGRKKHMTVARTAAQRLKDPAPWFAPPQTRDVSTIAVIGAGIAGLSVSQALAKRGKAVTLIDAREGPALGASGTPSGLIMPRLVADTDPTARFSAGAFRHAVGFYQAAGVLGDGGGVHLATIAQEAARFEFVAASGFFAADELEVLAPARVADVLGEASTLTGLATRGGALTGPLMAAFDLSNVDCLWNTLVTDLTWSGDQWHLEAAGALLGPFDAVVLASAMDVARLVPGLDGPLAPSAGQIVRVEGKAPHRPVTFGDYASPVIGGAWLGATHEGPDDLLTEDQARDKILASLGRLMPAASTSWHTTATWRGMRATTPDRLPIAGPVPDRDAFMDAFADLQHGAIYNAPPVPYRPGLYTMTGLGSRGLTTAPYLGEMIAAQICGEPWPVERDVADALHPARFWVRDLIKGRA